MNTIASTTTPTRQAWRDAPPRDARAHGLARALGWVSIGLGVLELVRPREVARSAGMVAADPLVRGYGVRELATGAALLASARAEPWLWARVAGDVVDIATVSAGLLNRPQAVRRGAGALLTLVAVTAVDIACAAALGRERRLQQDRQPIDFAQRSGFPRPAQQMRGVAVNNGRVAANGFDAATGRAQQPGAVGVAH